MKQCCTILLIIVIYVLGTDKVNAQNYMWVKGGGTSSSTATIGIHPEAVNYMCTDPNGNVYALSQVGDNSIIADTFYRASGAYGTDRNIFLSSYDCKGNMRWAKLIGSSGGECVGFGLVADSLGHIYVGGSLPTGALHIGYDTTLPTFIWASTGLISFDTNGHFNWIKYLGNLTSSSAYGTSAIMAPMTVDASNNVHTFPYIASGSTIAPGTASGMGVYDVVYNTAGTILSAQKLQLDSTLDITSVALDKQTNKAYCVGRRSASFGDSTAHCFLAAFDVSRNLIWLDTAYSPGFDGSGQFSSVQLDNSKHLYLTNLGYGSIVYRNDTIHNVLSLTPYALTCIMKMDTSGNLIWARPYSSSIGVNTLGSITLMPNNKIAACGVMAGMFVVETDTFLSYASEGQNAYFTIVDTGGHLESFNQLHGDGFYDNAIAITSDKVGNLYVGGEVADSIYGGSIPAYHTVGGPTDFFVMKYGVDCSCTTMPVANYTATGTHTVTFTYTGTTSGIDSVRWYFGDGGTSTAMNPVYIYTAAGTFAACVTVYSHCGNDEHCSTITIPCIAAPVASYTYSGYTTTTFTYTGAMGGTDSLRWYFGDGGTSTATNPVHSYPAIGIYHACVIAYSQCGNDTVCHDINIPCLSVPTAAYTESGSSTALFNYVGTTTGVDSITWILGDGFTATGSTVSHTYSIAGSYMVCVTAHSPCGNNTSCSFITVPCVAAPVASFGHSGGATSEFAYTGTTAGLDSVHWDFGDGSTGSGSATMHNYTAIGTYTVCATAYNPCGSNTYCSTVTVLCIAAPVASFSNTGSGHTENYTYTGTATSVDSVVWSFGDGNTANGTTATHTYAVADTYHVCVTAYSLCGNDSSCSDVIIVRPTSVTNLAFTDVQVYPNPATNELYISGITANTQYRILTVTGQAVQQGTLKASSNVLAMASVTNGVYLLELTGTDGAKQTFRIVKE